MPFLNRAERDRFLDRGVLFLPQAVPQAAIAAMRERLWAFLEARQPIRRDDPATWPKGGAWQFRDLRRSGAFAPLFSEQVRALLDEFFGARGWSPPAHPGLPLVTFPNVQAWAVPHQSWHLDLMPGVVLDPWPDHVRLFVLLADLAPGDGGTLVVEGSHLATLRLMAEAPSRAWIRSSAVADALAAESPWVAELCSSGGGAGRTRRLTQDGGRFRDIPIRVVEFTGRAGDVVLMHPGCLHAPAPNGGATPRLMLAETIAARD